MVIFERLTLSSNLLYQFGVMLKFFALNFSSIVRFELDGECVIGKDESHQSVEQFARGCFELRQSASFLYFLRVSGYFLVQYLVL